jgi:putative colanic acid biosynthesis acetyltransferase WcaF
MKSEVLKNNTPRTGPSFTPENQMKRALWNFTYTLLFKHSPRPLHAWRSFLLRLFGGKIGKGCHIYPKAIIWAPWNLECRDQAGIADNVTVYNQAKIYIGEKADISQGTSLITGSHDYTKENFPLFAKPIRINDNVWICAECFIHPGVTIGEGAVIGARSVVTHDMPAWMVCAGVPCKPIKKRRIK